MSAQRADNPPQVGTTSTGKEALSISGAGLGLDDGPSGGLFSHVLGKCVCSSPLPAFSSVGYWTPVLGEAQAESGGLSVCELGGGVGMGYL